MSVQFLEVYVTYVTLDRDFYRKVQQTDKFNSKRNALDLIYCYKGDVNEKYEGEEEFIGDTRCE